MIAIDDILQQPVTQAIGRALVQFVWQGALIGVLTAALLAALRRSAADVRYVVATIALSLMLTMPVVTTLQSFAVVPAVETKASVVESSARAAYERPAPRGQAGVAAQKTGLLTVASTPSAIDAVESWLPVLVSAWLIGVIVLTLRLLSGWIWVQRMKSHGVSAARASLVQLTGRLTKRLHITRTVRVLESTIIDVPTVIGWLKPVVLMPASALAGLTPQQLEAILAHELAHIRRHDYLVNLLQTVVETLLFYHPAVWWLSRRIRIERENCCDDLAVRLCGDPVTYAAALAEMEGLRGMGGRLVVAATGGSLLQRVRRLLGAPSHAGRAPGWLAAALAVVVIAGITAGALGRDVAAPGETQEIVASTRAVFQVPAAPSAPPARSAPSAPTAPSAPSAQSAPAAPAIAELRAATRAIDCVRWAKDRFPAPFRAQASSACQTIGTVHELAEEQARRIRALGRDAAPAVVQATTEPVEQVAAAIASASQTTASTIEPAIAAVTNSIEDVAAQVASTPGASSTRIRKSESADQQSGNYVWSNNGQKLEVNYRGDIEFTVDDTDVQRLSPGGWLRIKDGQRFGSNNTIEFRADANGKIERRFWVGNSERPFDPEGRKWLAQMLPRFVRQSGIGAAGRVERIFTSKGAAGVLSEVSLIEGSWAKRVYLNELLKMSSLTPRDVQQALVQAGREVDSDFELASLLISANRLVADDATRKAYFDAARTIESDFEMRRAFSAALKNGPVAPALLASMLDASVSIESDFEEASLLVDVATLQPLDATSRGPFFKALGTVGSAFEHRRALTPVLDRSDLTPEVLAAALESAALIDSDFEKASALLGLVKKNPIEGAARAPFFKAVSTIGSAFERGRVLQAVARRPDASDETILEVIRTAHPMSSDFEKAQVLLTVAGTHSLSREARDAYIDASNKLGDFEQGRVLTALVRNERRK